MTTVHVVVPAGVGDPSRPSGGNTYDRTVCAGLSGRGWDVRQREVPGRWPRADAAARAKLAAVLTGIPDGSLVLLDGLVACAVPEVLVPERRRLRLVVVVHLPLGHDPVLGEGAAEGAVRRERERAVLHAAVAVVATSAWTRAWLLTAYRLAPDRVCVVAPGVDPAHLMPGCEPGLHLLCVGVVSAAKGHDVLLAALADVADLEWTCRCVGSVAVDPAFASRVRARAGATGLTDRVTFTGPRVGEDLATVYAAADLVLAPSRTESYGMVVTEALARGVPVVGSDVGGLPEALGRARGGRRPGILVAPGDPAALAAALDRWLTDAGVRRDLRLAARARRATLADWTHTTDRLSGVLSVVAR
ncbi:glycosyltransferase family 4 protein [Fodinibacter luteus]|uniref:Glycosyltransferase family 4 protein n=1 Tax=Fodinibacter luteus TaxID=552064 RepID=A0ABP8KQZ5_9MICO